MTVRRVALTVVVLLVAAAVAVVVSANGASVAGEPTTNALAGLSPTVGSEPGWTVTAGADEWVLAQHIVNRSRFPMTVDRLDGRNPDPWFSITGGFEKSPPQFLTPPERGHKFPLRLAAGADAYLLIAYRPNRCFPMAPGGGLVFESVFVHHRTLGLGGTSEVAFERPIRFTAEVLRRHPVCSK